MRPKLSICIPTYNRCEILKDSINDIIPFLFERKIELCISNNASIDDTDNYLRKLTLQYPQIKYHLQKNNVGIDQNMLDVMLMATGEFIWPLGDDDKIIIDNFDNEFNKFSYDSDLYIFNGKHNDNFHLNKSLQGKSFHHPNEAFLSLWNVMPFGSFLFKRIFINPEYFSKYSNTSHAYTGIIWETFYDIYKENKNIKISCGLLPLVKFKKEVKTWKNDAFKIMYYEIPLWFSLLSEKYSVIQEEKILKKYLKKMSSIQNLILYSLLLNDFEIYIEKFMVYFEQSQKKKALFIAKIPKAILYPYYFGIVFLKKIITWVIR